MAIITLNGGFQACVDDSDVELLRQFNWCLINGRGDTKYAATIMPNSRKVVAMHRMLMPLKDRRLVVDHINGDGLDNRRANLRVATKNQNACNSKRHRTGEVACVYRGVEFARHMKSTPWRARIRLNGQRKHIGYFDTAEKAARAYDTAAVEHFGEFAAINF